MNYPSFAVLAINPLTVEEAKSRKDSFYYALLDRNMILSGFHIATKWIDIENKMESLAAKADP